MNEKEAREILGEYIEEDGVSLWISKDFTYITWEPGMNRIRVEGSYMIDLKLLEAILWWTKHRTRCGTLKND